MKLGRILGVVLSMLVVMFILNYAIFDSQDRDNSFELVQANEVVRDNTAFTGNKVLDMENTKDLEVLTFVNHESHSVTINKSNIQISCEGNGENRESDETLVENNLEIKASFSETEKGVKYDALEVGKNGSAYIFISSSYIGDTYPVEEVSCKYNLQIQAS